jgi:hypothetical protein
MQGAVQPQGDDDKRQDAATTASKAAPSGGVSAVVINAVSQILHTFSWILGSLAALITSTSFTAILTLTPVADDKWGLKACAAILRLGLDVHNSTREILANRSFKFALTKFAHLVTYAAVEASLLLEQPAFTTIAGGPFKLGAATKALAGRLARQAWLATDPSIGPHFGAYNTCVLLGAFTIAQLDLRKARIFDANGYPKQILDAVGSVAKAVAMYAFWCRGKVCAHSAHAPCALTFTSATRLSLPDRARPLASLS